jgi:hypothetical protein
MLPLVLAGADSDILQTLDPGVSQHDIDGIWYQGGHSQRR